LNDFEAEIDSLTLIPSDGGRFEFTVNGRLLFSKLQLGRDAESGEVPGLLRKYIKEGL